MKPDVLGQALRLIPVLRLAVGGAMLAMLSGVWAQSNYRAPSGNGADNPDWQEQAVPAAPAFSWDQVLRLDMPRHITVSVGVDPATIQVGGDGVVRYVVIMRSSSGTMNAVYEGIRCTTDEVKTYARFGSSGQWAPVAEPVWKPVSSSVPSPHAWVFARQAACPARLAAKREDILQALRQPLTAKPGTSTF